MRALLFPVAGLALLATACTVPLPPPPATPPAPAGSVAEQPPEYCREYTAPATVGGTTQQTVGTACLDPDGTWRIVDAQNAPSGNATEVVPPAAPPPAYPAYPYYPAYGYSPYPYYPYPAYWGPSTSVGIGFAFGSGGHHHHH